jgi:hypothetical protein
VVHIKYVSSGCPVLRRYECVRTGIKSKAIEDNSGGESRSPNLTRLKNDLSYLPLLAQLFFASLKNCLLRRIWNKRSESDTFCSYL